MFSSLNDAWGNDPVKDMTNKLTRATYDTNDETYANIYNLSTPTVNLSETSINLPSEMSLPEQIRHPKEIKRPLFYKEMHKNKMISRGSSKKRKNMDFSFSDTFDSSDFEKSSCASTVRHIKKCNKCYSNFKKIIDRKVKDQLQNVMLYNNLQQSEKTIFGMSNIAGMSDSWKETLIIVVGAVIAIFILFLISKSFDK